MSELAEADKSSFVQNDRSREFSGSMTQMSRMFAGNFMSHQGPDQATLADDSDAADSDNREEQIPCMAASNVNDTRGYDMSGSASLDSVLMANANVPEPFALNDAYEGTNLRPDGIPEGLSDRVVARGDRWVMENRIEIRQELTGNKDGSSA